LHLARAYLTASDPAFVERTWQVVMEQMQSRGKESSRERYASVFKSPSFDSIRNKKLMETTADDFFAVFKQNQVSINEFLKRLHNFAVHLGWIAIPIVAPYLWPKYEPKDRRGITQAEHESVLEKEKKAEWKLYLELLWETGAAQSDAVNFKAEDIDWQSRTISYFRMKTGSLAQFTISKKLETVLSHLPTTSVLFPNLSKFSANDRASRFRRRCHTALLVSTAPIIPRQRVFVYELFMTVAKACKPFKFLRKFKVMAESTAPHRPFCAAFSAWRGAGF
jgi:integrase